MKGNQICHFEIGVRDNKRAAEFYSKLFDWKMEGPADPAIAAGNPQVTMIRTGGDVGGHLNTLGHEPHYYTIFYVTVDDVDASVAKAESLGGKKIVGPLPIPGSNSWFAWIRDPEGNVIGIYTEK